MASTPPVCPNEWKAGGKGSIVCDLLNQLLLVSEQLYKFMSWMFSPTTCKLSPEFVSAFASTLQPIGSVVWSPTPLILDLLEWIPADGTNSSTYLKADYPELSSLYGTKFGTDPDPAKFKVPNLSGRTILGKGTRVQNVEGEVDPDDENPDPDLLPGTIDYTAGKMGGFDTVVLDPSEVALGDHRHGMGGVVGKQEPPIAGHTGTDAYYSHVDKAGIEVETYKGFQWVVSEGADIDVTPTLDGFTRNHILTTEPVAGISTEDPIPPEGHNNMMPHMAGVYYIRASHRVSGLKVPIA